MKKALLTPARRRAVVFMLASLVCATFVVAVSAHHSWRKYHWARTSNPFTVQLGDNVSSAWDTYLREASSDWSQSSVMDTTVVTGKTNGTDCKPTLGRVEV